MNQLIKTVYKRHKVMEPGRAFDDSHLDDIHAALIDLPERLQRVMLCDLYVESVLRNSEALHERLSSYHFYRFPVIWRIICLTKMLEVEDIRYSVIGDSSIAFYPRMHGLLHMFHNNDLEDLFSTLIMRSLKNPNISPSEIIAPLKLMSHEFKKRGLSENKAVDLTLKAFYQHAYNDELCSAIVKSLNNLFPKGAPGLDIFDAFGDCSQISELNGYSSSLDSYLSGLDIQPFTAKYESVLLGNLSTFPEICLYAIDRNLHKVVISGDDSFISKILHGHWLDKADDKTLVHGRSIINKIISSPYFHAANEVSDFSTFCGTLASVVSCAMLNQLGEVVKPPASRYGEELIASTSAASHFTKMTDAEVRSTKSCMMSMETANRFVDIYEALLEKGGHIKKAQSKMQQVQIVAALVFAEKHMGDFVDDELSISNIVYERNELGDALFQVEGFCSLAMYGMTQDQLMSVAPESDFYLKALITSGLVDKINMSKLSITARASIISHDLDI